VRTREKPRFVSCENLALAEDPTFSQFFRPTNSPAFLCPKLYPTPRHARIHASRQFSPLFLRKWLIFTIFGVYLQSLRVRITRARA
jgi:hypothetical protein